MKDPQRPFRLRSHSTLNVVFPKFCRTRQRALGQASAGGQLPCAPWPLPKPRAEWQKRVCSSILFGWVPLAGVPLCPANRLIHSAWDIMFLDPKPYGRNPSKLDHRYPDRIHLNYAQVSYSSIYETINVLRDTVYCLIQLRLSKWSNVEEYFTYVTAPGCTSPGHRGDMRLPTSVLPGACLRSNRSRRKLRVHLRPGTSKSTSHRQVQTFATFLGTPQIPGVRCSYRYIIPLVRTR